MSRKRLLFIFLSTSPQSLPRAIWRRILTREWQKRTHLPTPKRRTTPAAIRVCEPQTSPALFSAEPNAQKGKVIVSSTQECCRRCRRPQDAKRTRVPCRLPSVSLEGRKQMLGCGGAENGNWIFCFRCRSSSGFSRHMTRFTPSDFCSRLTPM